MAAGSLEKLFVEQPGYMEFTGRMIARPLQIETLLARGLGVTQAVTVRNEARALVEGITLEYVEATDEYIIQVPAGKDENSLARELLASGAFQYVEPDWRVFPQLIPNDPQYGSQYHHTRVFAPQAWDMFTGDNTPMGYERVIVAITDTGVRLTHQDLRNLLVNGYNSVTGLRQQDGGQVNDINGHGTHCAGIAGAEGNNGLNGVGYAWRHRIMPVRVTNSSDGSSSLTWITNGIRWAADNGARIVSTSYSGASNSTVQTTGAYVKNTRNGLSFWAAGNNGQRLTGWDHPDVTIVGATNANNQRASFSNFGIPIDVFAPGENIFATYNTSDSAMTTLSGTSMACPGAAGLGALMMAANPFVGAQQIETTLYQSCTSMGNPDDFGWGLVHSQRSLQNLYANFDFLVRNVSAQRGRNATGGVGDLRAPDDNRFFTIQNSIEAVAGQVSRTEVVYEFNSTTSIVTRLDFTYRGFTNVNGIGRATYLWNWSTNQWELVDDRLDATTNTTTTISITSNPGRFVQAGSRQVRALVINRRTVPGQAQQNIWTVSVDYVGVRTRAN